MGKAKTKSLCATELTKRLETRFNTFPREWAFYTEVQPTGGGRRIDAVAVNLWGSRGREVHGFELKSSRSDWLRELKNPAKAEASITYCDRWIIVSGARDMIDPDELPPGWGLWVPHGKGLTTKIHPKKLHVAKLTREFYGRLLDRTYRDPPPGKKQLDEAWNKGYGEGHDSAVKSDGEDLKHAESSLANIKKRIREFEKASGIKIEHEWNLGEAGEAVRFLRMIRSKTGYRRAEEVERMSREVGQLGKRLQAEAEALHKIARNGGRKISRKRKR